MEKKQKKFDTQVAEKIALAEKNAAERDTAEAHARQAETKSLSLTRELEELQDRVDETERLRKQLQVHHVTLWLYMCRVLTVSLCSFLTSSSLVPVPLLSFPPSPLRLPPLPSLSPSFPPLSASPV